MNKNTVKFAVHNWNTAERYRKQTMQTWINHKKKMIKFYDERSWHWLFEAVWEGEEFTLEETMGR